MRSYQSFVLEEEKEKRKKKGRKKKKQRWREGVSDMAFMRCMVCLIVARVRKVTSSRLGVYST